MQQRIPLSAIAAGLVALGLAASAAPAQTLFEEAFELDNLGGELGLSVTLPEGWETGRVFGNLALSLTTGDRDGLLIYFYRADASDLRSLLSDSSLDSFWNQRRPIERSEGEVAGHPAVILRTERQGRAGSFDPVSGRRHEGERMIVVFDHCVAFPNRPVAMMLAAGIGEGPIAEDPDIAGVMSSLSLTLPPDPTPCDPALMDGLRTVQGEIDLSGW